LQFLFEPWKAPLAVQEEADCVIGRDYPEPCIDLEQASEENIAKLKQFFQNGKRDDIFYMFLNDTHVLRPANPAEYRFYTYTNILRTQFDDF
jgi:hypothetical protein